MKKILFCFIHAILLSNYSETGPYEVSVLSDIFTLSSGHSIEYSFYTPVELIHNTQVNLIHATSRNMDSYYELAEHYASWGLGVITMNLLYSSIFENDPLQDAVDLRELSNHFSSDNPVIYAGHSSGGIRAIISAAGDTNTVAVLGLDLTDGIYDENDVPLALLYASNLTIPVWGLLGEESICNENGNGLDVYMEAENGNAISITEADHCDFEFPTDIICTIFCQSGNENYSEEEIKSVILNLSTSYILYHNGNQDDSNLFWTPGNYYYDELIELGAIEQLTVLDIENEDYLPNNIILHSNYPNPFNPVTNISYDTIEESFISVKIKDIKGRHIITLINRYHPKGKHIITWNGYNSRGYQQPSGIYFYTIKNENFSRTGKMILLK